MLAKLDRTLSGFECSCSPNSPGLRQTPRLGLKPRRAKSLPVRHAAIIDYAEEITEPETELLSRDLLEKKFSGKHGSQISKLQALERLKGDMRTALLDLEEPSNGFSESDREKLHLARQRHAIEEQQADSDALKERRKEERAAKRAARKEAASQQLEEVSATASPPVLKNISRSKVTAGSTSASRRADKGVSGNPRSRVRGAKAFASSRTRTQATWGKQYAAEASEEGGAFLKSVGNANTNGTFQQRSKDAYGDFLKNMPKHQLLTLAEEAALSKKVQDWILFQNKHKEFGKKHGRLPTNPEWAATLGISEEELNQRWKDGNQARSKMLTCNQRLVVSIALKYQDKGLELTDLIAEGMAGLARSVEKYDYSKGFKFSTYATWWVRQAISRAIGDLSKTIRLPCHLLEILGRVTRAEAEHMRLHNAPADVEYLAKKLKLPQEKIKMVKQAALNPKLLDDPAQAGDADMGTFGESLEDNSVESTQNELVVGSLHAEVDSVLSRLSPRENGILRMRYGLDDGQPKTLEDIGYAFNVTRERIRQIENKAMSKLKELDCNTQLRPFVNGEAMEYASDEVGWKANIKRA